MWLMLQVKKPDDYVVATGETHSVREFVEEAAKQLGMEIVWKGKGIKERGIDKKTGKVIVAIDSKYFRPAEVDLLIGDPAKARKMLKWRPKTSFKQLVKLMVDADLELQQRQPQ
jgi:GDPmannose 4,6-dehydratase